MRDGQAMLDAAIHAGLEGIVAKRLDSPYLPGVRTDAWLKIKGQLRQEFVICGYTPGKGAHKGRVGALLLGYYEPERSGRRRRLHFAGKVGTGLSSADRIALKRSLDARRRTLTPFDIGKPETDVVFSEPISVAEIEFYEWTRDGRLRHPVFKGLRDDKDPGDVVREEG
jgi:bifunctional non-homologous end joining protein LigD